MARHRVLKHFAEEFSELVRKHARRCVENETGCLQFSVSRDIDDENRWCYYELYASREDFDAHCATAHYRQQIERVTPMIDGDVDVVISRLIENSTKTPT